MRSLLKLGGVALGLVLAFAASANAASILQVEFGGTFLYPHIQGDGGAANGVVQVQPGWSQFQDIHDIVNPSKTFGPYTVTIFGRELGGDKDSIPFGGSVTLGAMYSDFTLAYASGHTPLEISGLAAERSIWIGLGSWLFADFPAQAALQLREVGEHERLGSALFSWDSIRESPALRDALVAEVPGG